MKNKYLYWIIVIIVVFGLAVLMFFHIFKKADITVASKKVDVEIVASILQKNFETDEKTANAKYLNKIIVVSGIVDNITDTKEDITVYLKPKDKTSGVMCSFDKTVFKKSSIKPGDQVKIKGICNGYLMDVVLNKCAIVK